MAATGATDSADLHSLPRQQKQLNDVLKVGNLIRSNSDSRGSVSTLRYRGVAGPKLNFDLEVANLPRGRLSPAGFATVLSRPGGRERRRFAHAPKRHTFWYASLH